MRNILSLLIWGIIIYIIIKKNKSKRNIEEISPTIPTNYIENNYAAKNSIMTKTEQIFYNQLEKTINEKNLNLKIFPQVNLESIVQVKNKEYQYRNKIKSKSIDFTIVSEDNYKIICCIELDDYTHNRPERIERDIFVNELFKTIGIKLLRIKVSDNYDIENILNQIKEVG